MLSFLNQYAKNYIYSQNGEEGLLLECARRLGIEKGKAVEIGGSDGRFCSNTALLIDRGWSGTFIETNYGLHLVAVANWAHRKDVKCICSTVDGYNVNAFVDDTCDVLSTDTDGADYEIFQGLKARPKIVIVEIDSSLPPDSNEFNSDGASGYMPMVELGLGKGYFLLAHTGNLVFVRDEYTNLFNEVWGTHPLKNSELYFNRAWMKDEAA